jgi:hypothetical protein
MYIGWFTWPKEYKAYCPGINTSPIPADNVKDSMDHLRSIFQSTSFWNKFLEFVSQESNRQNEGFSSTMASLYKSIFCTFEDTFLDVVIGPLTKLSANAGEKSHHKAAAELLCGIIRGSKNWGQESINNMWTKVTPIIRQGLETANPDTLDFWEQFVKYSCVSGWFILTYKDL